MVHLTDAIGIGLLAGASGLYGGFIWGWRWAEKARDGLDHWNDGYDPAEALYCEQHELVEAAGGSMRWCRWCPYTEAPRAPFAPSSLRPLGSSPRPAPPTPATTLAAPAGVLAGEAPGAPEGHTGWAIEVCPRCGHPGSHCVCYGIAG